MALNSEGTGLAAQHLEISGLFVRETDPTVNPHLILTGLVTGHNPGEAGFNLEVGLYSHGCMLTRTDGANGRNANFENVGTSASPSWKVWATV